MKWLKLTMVVDTRRQHHYGEDDGIQETEVTAPVMVAVDKIRNFYPRRPNVDGSPRAGTRLVLEGGAGLPVTESFDDVVHQINN